MVAVLLTYVWKEGRLIRSAKKIPHPCTETESQAI